MTLKLLDRYIVKECALATFSVILVLLVILLGNTLVRILGDIIEGQLPDNALLPMLLISLVHYLVILVPIGMYLGILLGMGRLYKDSEMAALGACGVGTKQLYRPILLLAIPLTLLSAWIALDLAPWAASQQDLLKHKAETRSELVGLVPGQFNRANGGNLTFFFEKLSADGEEMRGVFLHQSDTTSNRVYVAESAVRINRPGSSPYIVFHNGTSYTGHAGTLDYRTTQFDSYGVKIDEDPPTSLDLRISAMPTMQLFTENSPEVIAERHWRFAIPITCFLLALLALPLSYTSPRKGRFAKLGAAILVYIVYSNMIGLGKSWLEQSIVPDWLGLWWAHIGFALAIYLLLLSQQKFWFTKSPA